MRALSSPSGAISHRLSSSSARNDLSSARWRRRRPAAAAATASRPTYQSIAPLRTYGSNINGPGGGTAPQASVAASVAPPCNNAIRFGDPPSWIKVGLGLFRWDGAFVTHRHLTCARAATSRQSTDAPNDAHRSSTTKRSSRGEPRVEPAASKHGNLELSSLHITPNRTRPKLPVRPTPAISDALVQSSQDAESDGMAV
uniref:Uncharacterized protein n=1 Tax=Plectus sambesii TaxID=2011161 RepID=A0A914VBX1_9BILA